MNPIFFNPHIWIAPNKHRSDDKRAIIDTTTVPPAGANIASAELPTKPRIPPNTPNPEPMNVKIHKTVKKVGRFASPAFMLSKFSDIIIVFKLYPTNI